MMEDPDRHTLLPLQPTTDTCAKRLRGARLRPLHPCAYPEKRNPWVVQCVLAAEAIRAILEARGEHSSPRTRPPARAPPQLSLGFASTTSAKNA